METYFDFSAGDKMKVAASHLARLHEDLGGDYESVVMAVIAGICQGNPSSDDFYTFFLGNRIRNYCDLAAAQLNALAEPPGTPILQTIFDSRENIGRHLRAQGVPEQFISGDNAGLTMELIRELRECSCCRRASRTAAADRKPTVVGQ
jgi:hypothetical protein